MDLATVLNDVNLIARAAGQAILEVYEHDDIAVDYKDDKSPLTLADQRSHEALEAGLTKLDMGPILSEEGPDIDWPTRQGWNQYWLLDPLDGTKEFIKRNGEFTVNIALIRDGAPILGVVYAPVKGLLYYGAKSVGAFKQEDGEAPRPIHTSPAPKQNERWVVAGSRSHQSQEFKELVGKIPNNEIVSMGSSLKLCLVADGSADLYPRLGLTSEWDTAAAQGVVEAAGGYVLDWDSQTPLRYNTKESLLNPYFIVCSEPSLPQWLRLD